MTDYMGAEYSSIVHVTTLTNARFRPRIIRGTWRLAVIKDDNYVRLGLADNKDLYTILQDYQLVGADVYTDNINEYTPDAGVTIEGVLIKDGLVDGIDVSALGGLDDDDYVRVDGTNPLTAQWNPGAFIIGNYDFTAKPGTLYVGDANFELYLEAGGPVIVFDTGFDFLGYVRASNTFTFAIGGVSYMQLETTGLLVDHILELAANHGVEIDGCLIKDGRAALALGLRETGGPTDLIAGAIVDGEFLKRVGTEIVSDTPAGGSADNVNIFGKVYATPASTTIPKLCIGPLAFAGTFVKATGYSQDVATDGNLKVDIHKRPAAYQDYPPSDAHAVTIFTTQTNRLTIASGHYAGYTGVPEVSTFDKGDWLDIYADVVGGGITVLNIGIEVTPT